jgi:hypothetical protein
MAKVWTVKSLYFELNRSWEILGALGPARGRAVYCALSDPLCRTVRRPLDYLTEAYSWIIFYAIGI